MSSYMDSPEGEQGLSSVNFSLGEALLLFRIPLLMHANGLLSAAALSRGDMAEGGVIFLLCNSGSNFANKDILRKSSSRFYQPT